MVNVRQDHIVPDLPWLANMAWTLDLAKQHALSELVFCLSTHTCMSTYLYGPVCLDGLQVPDGVVLHWS